jgi:carboxyl-terminal processing protease
MRRLTLLVVSLLIVLFVLAGAVMARVGGERDAYRFLSVFGDALQLMRSHYVEQLADDVLREGAFEGMVSGLDGFSAYLDADERAELERPRPAGGTGLVILPGGGGAVIVKVRAGSPGDESGLKPLDQIWAIDGRPTRGKAFVQILRELAGEPGDVRTLNVLDGGTFARREVEVVLSRAAHAGASVTLEEGGVALLSVNDLSRVKRAEVVEELDYARRKGAGVLLVDLRGLVEGTPQEAARLLSLFVEGGAAVTITDRSGDEETTPIPAGKVAWNLPVRVLVDRATAGGGEIVAAALRDRAGAEISGETTFGNGSLQEVLGFEDGSGVLLSTRSMSSPSGTTWNGSGLEPDERIEQEPGARRGESPDAQLARALDWSRALVEEPAA